MHRVLIFGNSGSGKSTLAAEQAKQLACPHLDLDTVAWEDGCATPTRRAPTQSAELIAPFLANNERWVIEGCYADLLELVIHQCTEVVFLNPGVDACSANCKRRPWEPHKYASPEAQDANLAMLLAWVEQYPERSDEFSLQAHRRLFDQYAGKKREFTSNDRSGPGP